MINNERNTPTNEIGQAASEHSKGMSIKTWKRLSIVAFVGLPLFTAASVFEFATLINAKWVVLGLLFSIIVAWLLPYIVPTEFRYGSDEAIAFKTILRGGKVVLRSSNPFGATMDNTDERELLNRYKAAAFGQTAIRLTLLVALIFQIAFVVGTLSLDLGRSAYLGLIFVNIVPLVFAALFPVTFLVWTHKPLEKDDLSKTSSQPTIGAAK